MLTEAEMLLTIRLVMTSPVQENLVAQANPYGILFTVEAVVSFKRIIFINSLFQV